MAETMARAFDVVLFGATGFTGRLVAGYLLGRAAKGRLAFAGRDRAKLAALAKELGQAAADVPILVGDASDSASLRAIAGQTKVVCTTVGPYARHGAPLVAACVESRTDYCDLTGEPHFIRRMIDAHQERARETDTRIVHTCGFDSIPSDLGVWFLQRHAVEVHGAPAQRVTLGITKLKGGASGGTIASMFGVMDEARRDRDVRHILLDPYALNPEGERSGPDRLGARGPAWDDDLRAWTAPFVMSGINEPVVRRTNALTGFSYGRSFRYHEVMSFRPGPRGFAQAVATTAAIGALFAGASIPAVRGVLERTLLPAPGEGPSEAARESGCFEARLVGVGEDARSKPFEVRAVVAGQGDPGYAATARMLGESALSLAEDPRGSPGGILTPAYALGDRLLKRLQSAGVRFEIRS